MLDVDSPNLYAFVGWQPNMGVDPLGLWEVSRALTGSYDAAASEAFNPSNTWYVQGGFGLLALAVAPVAGAEQLLNFVVDTPPRMIRSSKAVPVEIQAAIEAEFPSEKLRHSSQAFGSFSQLFVDVFIVESVAQKVIVSAAKRKAVQKSLAAGGGEFEAGAAEAVEVQAAEATAAELTPVGGVPARVGELRSAIPAAQQGRITMGVGLAEDATGVRQVLVSTSEPRGYLRPGVTLAPGETLAPGLGHAEADLASFAQQNNLRLLEVGATRPICTGCAAIIEEAGAIPVTPLKPVRVKPLK